MACARNVKGRKMKMTISGYWPLVVAVTLVTLSALQA
ncbi:MAG: hypothetical protein QOI13_2327, partial [Paraburkholderia sp.]|nr:hypothetical protein [Paraburkholderia sp.]